MKKIISFMHASLDGFVAGPNGEMDWIKADDEMFDLTDKLIAKADTALYGRITYNMMEAYWPTAAENPEASKHDISHARWYNQVEKIVVSTSLQHNGSDHTAIIGTQVTKAISKIKRQKGGNIVMFGSPSIVHALTSAHLIDEYWVCVNPVLLGEGIPLFKDFKGQINLKLVKSKKFKCGVMGLHYKKIK